ncbi:type II/IV secretion system protein [Candidatus Uhrbacteria bacterium]|nr:type II/IV secretion system protein [Candidatus Uhrbacteria bacterium]
MPPQPPKPIRSQSIEDLFKKTEAPAPAPSPLMQAPKIKEKPKAAGKAIPSTPAGKLEERMTDIRLRETEEQAQELAATYGLPYISLKGFPIAPEALALISRPEAESMRLVAFLKLNDELRIATAKPGKEVEDFAAKLAKDQAANVQIYIISEESFKMAMKLYDALPEIREVIYGVRIEEATLKKYAEETTDLKKLQETIQKVNTTDAVALILGGAINLDASDVHIEAEEKDVRIRYRMDGDLHDAARMPRDAWKQLIGRFKLLAGVKINIGEVPQDGRITIYLSNEKIDIRVSFLPTAFGESVVMRLLRPKSIALEFEQLGVRGRAWEALKAEIEKPNGMIVTTGPTGSGKTTTLYAILKRLNTEDVKIITLEDPVEYKLQGVNQSQIDHAKGYTFAGGLRSILRQDPDVVMVGEIRDLETAEISIQAALTGHLVVSTIHTNSAAGAVPRFLSMGVKPFLLAPAINCIIGQRLVKRLHPDHKVPAVISESLLAQVKAELGRLKPEILKEYNVDLNNLQFFAPKEGVKNGYKGRLGIYEIFPMTKDIERLILSGKVSEYDMIDIALKNGMITMAQDGILKALDGLTSIEEVLRVAEFVSVQEDTPEETI